MNFTPGEPALDRGGGNLRSGGLSRQGVIYENESEESRPFQIYLKPVRLHTIIVMRLGRAARLSRFSRRMPDRGPENVGQTNASGGSHESSSHQEGRRRRR